MKHLTITMPGHVMLFIMLFAATGQTYAQQLPNSWQTGMALTTWHGAGMRQQTDSLRIADDSSFERHSGMDNNKKYSFHFSPQELNALLSFLKEKHFNKINTAAPAVVYDGWSSDITLQWKNQIIIINTGAAYEVPLVYRKDLSDILQYVNHMVELKKRHR